jgi:hypothetical protein
VGFATSLYQNFSILNYYPFVDSKCFLLRDDDDPKKDAATSPLLDALTISKESSQEETVVVKSSTVPPAKSTPTHASKRLKKAATVRTSLEAHRPAASSDDVSIASCTRFFHFLIFSHIFCFADFDAKISLPWR